MWASTVSDLLQIIEDQENIITYKQRVIDRMFKVLSLHLSAEELEDVGKEVDRNGVSILGGT